MSQDRSKDAENKRMGREVDNETEDFVGRELLGRTHYWVEFLPSE